jgi:hypothetical protein
MRALAPAEVVRLTDAAGRDFGSVAVESMADGLILGTFTPGPDYPAVEPRFAYFAEVADTNSLSFLDEAEAGIAALGVRLRVADEADPVAVSDVQIFPDGGFSCRLPPTPADRNGPPAAG